MNQREIKFRAGDKKLKKMVFIFAITSGGKMLAWSGSIGGWIKTDDKRFIKLQYTGLKDKNDKEIYEGDIGWHSSDEGGETKVGHHEVVFVDGAFRLKNKEGKIVGIVRGTIFEVLGNIYENKELLK